MPTFLWRPRSQALHVVCLSLSALSLSAYIFDTTSLEPTNTFATNSECATPDLPESC